MRPLQISADTALKLSKALGVPMEQLMHMPQHILLKKLAELAQAEAESSAADDHTSTENPK
ncbi:YycC family protein [Paenibacillus sp. OSY-SE]|uniref:YycC family protein n=1 Tax=Paenibacillus sp. OSY-SE TaxID=1196323 RepID=UPI0002FEBC89|nr:YycC family protein [Paenibacillus sp. OSY-SE]